MAGRPKKYDENEVLDKAIAIFWDKGYENASADDLLQAMNIGKGSFYLAFKGGKRELFEKSMKRFVQKYFSEMEDNIRNCDNPILLIKSFFLQMETENSLTKDKGCYFGNALIQIADNEVGLKILANNYLKEIENFFTLAIQIAQEKGQLKSEKSAAFWGLYLLNFWNGINITQRMQIPKETLKELIEQNLVGLQ